MHILRKILWKLCVGTCLLEPNVATPLRLGSVKHIANCPVGMKIYVRLDSETDYTGVGIDRVLDHTAQINR